METRDQATVPEDKLLTFLIQMVNGSEAEFGMTLNIGGVVVSGYLVGQQRYFGEGFAEDFGELLGKSERKAEVKDAIGKPGKFYEEADLDFIHMKDARIFLGTTVIPSGNGIWWRGRVKEVQGYSLGVLGRVK